MDESSIAIRQRLKDDFEHYASKCLTIVPKKGQFVPFTLNRAQKYIHAKVEEQRRKTGMVRAVLLKGRQQGCSTYVEGRFFWRVTHQFGMKAFILTHETSATDNLFKMAKLFYEKCPAPVRPQLQASNAKELLFSVLKSGYKLGTAGNEEVGRSSTIQYLHASEAGLYRNAPEIASGLLQTVPFAANTEIFIESTAKGVGTWFHQQWQAAESGNSPYIAIFIPWYWQDEYAVAVLPGFVRDEEEEELKAFYNLTNEQLQWRRFKISEFSVNGIDGNKLFRQEYPCNPTEAFQFSSEDTFISPDLVMRARMHKDPIEPVGPLIIGVDPARFGDDRTAIIRRQGRVAFNLQHYDKKDCMEVCGLVHSIITKEKPAKVFIDVGGLGAGIIDRLFEIGHKGIVVPVNSANSALDEERYTNKRAEMWGIGKEWLNEGPVKIPNDDALHADLCGVKYSWDSKSRLKIERKEDMKKRGIRSSDLADALLLTFAQPVRMNAANNNSAQAAKQINERLKKFTSARRQANRR